MKNIWLMGGFGNTLFQILAYRVVIQNNDAKFISILTEKNFITKLMGWTIHEPIYKNFIKSEKFGKIGSLKSIWILSLSMISRKFGIKNFISTFYTNKIKFKEPYTNNIFGYFQEKYFLEKNKDLLLQLGNDIHSQYKINTSEIIVHYRMGDSDWAKQYENYYINIKNLIKKEDSVVLIATDSPKEALEFFSDCRNVKLTDAKSAIDDFRYMVSASKLYCAPSTFSWWAAHSLKSDVPVIMPKFLIDTLGCYLDKQRLVLVDNFRRETI